MSFTVNGVPDSEQRRKYYETLADLENQLLDLEIHDGTLPVKEFIEKRNGLIALLKALKEAHDRDQNAANAKQKPIS